MNRADDSSEDLMACVARGSDEALTTLMRRFATPLLTFIQRMIGDRQQAEELFQEVFLAVWIRRHQYRYPRRFQSWLFAIALNRCRAEFRRPRLTMVGWEDQSVWEPAAPDPSPVQRVMADERTVLVATAVANLPTQQRTVVVLRIYNGLPYGEIADVMGLRTATVRSHMLHGLAALRRALQPRLE